MLSQLSTAEIHGHQVSADQMQEIIEELQLADELWERAQDASENAPPDPDFPRRLRALADACERQAAALSRAGATEGFAWTPLADRRYMALSHELRPGGNRPGPPALWAEFDRAVQRLGIAMGGNLMYTVAFQIATSPRSCTGSPTCGSVRHPRLASAADDRGGLVRDSVRNSSSCAVQAADHRRPPSAPSLVGFVRRPPVFVAADYPPSTRSFG